MKGGGNGVEIEDSQLLRRLIARRCIYGVDLNHLSVQLARLAVWIHTFVPGLPLSYLDHNLVHGNALVGVATINDIKHKVGEKHLPLFPINADSLLGVAVNPLELLASINDATLDEIAAARNAQADVRKAISDTENLCNIVTAQPTSNNPQITDFLYSEWELNPTAESTEVVVRASKELLQNLHPLHFPVAFPEVFLRERSGFDVILGNPPWNKVKIEEHSFWARYFPGFKGMRQLEQEKEKNRLREERADLFSVYEQEKTDMERIRKILTKSGAYPGIGKGDPDLYIAFCWRFLHLTVKDSGRIGVVLPRSALNAKGSEEFRQILFKSAASVDVTMLLNRRGWVFDDAEHRYSISLVCVTKGDQAEKSITLRGQFTSEAMFQAGIGNPVSAFDFNDVLSWTNDASLPILPNSESAGVFKQIRKAPRLDLNEHEAKLGRGAMAFTFAGINYHI